MKKPSLMLAVISAAIAIFLPGVAIITLIALWAYNKNIDEYFEYRKEESSTIINSAQRQADDIISAGSKTADDLVQAAQQKADGLVQAAHKKAAELKEKLANMKAEITTTKKDLAALEEKALIESIALEPLGEETSEEFKNKLAILQQHEADMVAGNKAVIIYDQESAKRVINNNVKQLLRCFNTECATHISSITYKNIDNVRTKIQKSFTVLNKIFETDGIELNKEYLALRLEEARLVYAYQEKKGQERQQQIAIKEQMVEEDKVRREIEKEKAKIEKEENQFKGEVNKLMQYMQKAKDEVERNLYADKIKALDEKLSLLEKDKENVLDREQNTRAGFVYVISNIGSLGENVYKIGMTRRLEPMDRIKELSSASVPFGFDVHAMIFSEDAPALETLLHQTFRKYQVNKVNEKKEFFKVPLEEVETVVKNKYNATVTFTMVAEAAEYRESLKLAKA